MIYNSEEKKLNNNLYEKTAEKKHQYFKELS